MRFDQGGSQEEVIFGKHIEEKADQTGKVKAGTLCLTKRTFPEATVREGKAFPQSQILERTTEGWRVRSKNGRTTSWGEGDPDLSVRWVK